MFLLQVHTQDPPSDIQTSQLSEVPFNNLYASKQRFGLKSRGNLQIFDPLRENPANTKNPNNFRRVRDERKISAN